MKVCTDLGASYIDVREVFGILLKNGNDYHAGDGMHLDKYGYELFINKFVQIIKLDLKL